MADTSEKKNGFIKKRGFVLLSFFFLALFLAASAACVLLYINLGELKGQSLAQQKEIDALSAGAENSAAELDEARLEIYELQKAYEESTAESEALRKDSLENQMLLDRKQLMEQSQWKKYTDEDLFEKIVYLTFDDGPSPRTHRILDILDDYNIKATFFVNYNAYADENNLYAEIVDRGHVIGNHTYDHVLAAGNWDAFYESLFKMEDYIFEKTGVRTNIVRFPGGSKDSWERSEKNKERAMELVNMGYVFFDWNVSNNDSNSDVPYMQADQMADYVINCSAGRDKIILLMHDRTQKYSTVESLKDIIKYYRDKGYVFLPLTENSVRIQFFSPFGEETEPEE